MARLPIKGMAAAQAGDGAPACAAAAPLDFGACKGGVVDRRATARYGCVISVATQPGDGKCPGVTAAVGTHILSHSQT